jgi:hypothetical protein
LGGKAHPLTSLSAFYLRCRLDGGGALSPFSGAKLLEAVERGLLVSRFDTQVAAPRLRQLVKKYADLPMDFADACLVHMSEQTKDCRIVTIDRADFMVYRRHGREPIPLVLPD